MVNSFKLATSIAESNMDLLDQLYQNDQNERTVYLGDLGLEIDENDIENFFRMNSIEITKIVKQPHSSFAHVTFKEQSIAKQLLQLTILKINNQVVRVMPFNQPNNFDPEANLIIKNLEAYLNEVDIINKFRVFGQILSCKLVRNENGESKCYAYLQFKHRESATEAIDKLNNTYWDESFDPDVQYKVFQQKLNILKHNDQLSKITEEDLRKFAESKFKYGKKIYVGLFKKKDEYSKLKQDKEGKLSNLYVKNFGPEFGDRDLFNLFKSYGSIKSAKVRRLKCGPVEKPLGCGFVDFEHPEDAERARLALDGYLLGHLNRKISVTYADCKSRRMRKKMEEENKLNEMNSSTSNLSSNDSSNTSISLDENMIQQNMAENFNDLTNLVKPIMHPQSNEYSSPNYVVNDDLDNDRNRSFSRCSESSNESVFLFDWSEIWNRKLCTNTWNEYKLF